MELHDDYADVMTLDEFNRYRKVGAFISYDGDGYYGTATHQSNVNVWSDHPIPEGTTHVAWYNR